MHRGFIAKSFMSSIVALLGVIAGQAGAARSPQPEPPGAQMRRPLAPDQASRHSGPPPVAEYERSDRQVRPKRAAKDKRLQHLFPRPLADPAGELGRETLNDRVDIDYVGVMQALPIAKATTIILGTVTRAKSFVTPDKTGVYSEFAIRVNEVLKQDDVAPVTAGEIVIGTRLGGSVAFPSGRRENVIIEAAGFPKENVTYVLFGWRSPETDDPHDYGIYTAYEISGGLVYPLDDGPLFARYEGACAIALIAEIKQGLGAVQKGDR